MLRGETDEAVLSRAATLGWQSAAPVVVVVGSAPELEPALALEAIRHASVIRGADMLGAVQGDRMIIVLGSSAFASADLAAELVQTFTGDFGPRPNPSWAHQSSTSWRLHRAPVRRCLVSCHDGLAGGTAPSDGKGLLPERALAGDSHARRELARDLSDPLLADG